MKETLRHCAGGSSPRHHRRVAITPGPNARHSHAIVLSHDAGWSSHAWPDGQDGALHGLGTNSQTIATAMPSGQAASMISSLRKERFMDAWSPHAARMDLRPGVTSRQGDPREHVAIGGASDLHGGNDGERTRGTRDYGNGDLRAVVGWERADDD